MEYWNGILCAGAATSAVKKKNINGKIKQNNACVVADIKYSDKVVIVNFTKKLIRVY